VTVGNFGAGWSRAHTPDRAAEAAASYVAAGEQIGPAFEAVMAALDHDVRWPAACSE
jgi:hypothetical protein